MRRILTLLVGLLIGEWLTVAGWPSPASLYRQGQAAWEHNDYDAALRFWSQAVSQQPDNALLHYRRAAALARLGHRHAAEDAYRLALRLEPPQTVAQQAQQELANLVATATTVSDAEATVALEPARGVWVVPVLLNGDRPARFLVDTGSSVTILGPALAAGLGLAPTRGGPSVELQTLAGHTTAPTVRISSIRVGAAELRNVTAVVHDPGPDLDGILGNSFLGRYRVTLDADRHLLHLRRPSLD